MRYLMLTSGVVVIVMSGLLIDAQSRPPRDVALAARVPAPSEICAVGRVEGITPEVELRPRVDGYCVRLLVAEGDTVEDGQVLLQLDDVQQRRRVDAASAEADLAQAQLERLTNGARREERTEAASKLQAKVAELENARLTWQRSEALHEAKAIAKQELDDHRGRLQSVQAEVDAAQARLQLIEAPARPDERRVAQARLEAAQARLQLAETELQWTQLRAPSDGQILKIHIEPGERAGPGSLEPTAILADTSQLRVRAFVEELDAPRVQLGMTATVVADGLAGREFKGRVVRLSPRMGPKTLWGDRPTERHDTLTREIWIELEPAEGLIVGLRVDVRVDVDERT